MKIILAALVTGGVFAASALFAGSMGTNSIGASTNGIAASFNSTVVSTNTGQYAAVDSQKEVVTLYDQNGHVIWTTNIVAGLQSAPVMGQRKISGMQMYQGDLWVNVGRGYGIINIKTGSMKGFAQD